MAEYKLPMANIGSHKLPEKRDNRSYLDFFGLLAGPFNSRTVVDHSMPLPLPRHNGGNDDARHRMDTRGASVAASI